MGDEIAEGGVSLDRGDVRRIVRDRADAASATRSVTALYYLLWRLGLHKADHMMRMFHGIAARTEDKNGKT